VSEDDAQRPRRLILVGASNLTRGLPIVVNTCRQLLGGPIELIAALGHGRSYGMSSRVFGRTLPSILDCGLWDALSQPKQPGIPSLSTPLALITDIGNDIMYDQPPAQIAAWVGECIARLRRHDARIAMTQMPLVSIRSLKPWQFKVLRSLLFPTRRLTFDQVLHRLNDLNDRLADVAARFNIPMIELPPHWYGFDPIHLRRRVESEAWQSIMCKAFKLPSMEGVPAASSLAWRWRCHRMRPAAWRWLGLTRTRPQPAARLSDQSTISLY